MKRMLSLVVTIVLLILCVSEKNLFAEPGDVRLDSIINNSNRDLLLASVENNTINLLQEIPAGSTTVLDIAMPVTIQFTHPDFKLTQRKLYLYAITDAITDATIPILSLLFTRILQPTDYAGNRLVTVTSSLKIGDQRIINSWANITLPDTIVRICQNQEDTYIVNATLTGTECMYSTLTVITLIDGHIK